MISIGERILTIDYADLLRLRTTHKTKKFPFKYVINIGYIALLPNLLNTRKFRKHALYRITFDYLVSLVLPSVTID